MFDFLILPTPGLYNICAEFQLAKRLGSRPTWFYIIEWVSGNLIDCDSWPVNPVAWGINRGINTYINT